MAKTWEDLNREALEILFSDGDAEQKYKALTEKCRERDALADPIGKVLEIIAKGKTQTAHQGPDEAANEATT